MRATIVRDWSEDELGRAKLIAESLWNLYMDDSTKRMGRLQAIRAAEWPVDRKKRSRYLARLTDIMPLVCRIVAETHPGHTINLPGDGTLCITPSPKRGLRQALPRTYKAHTALARAQDELTTVTHNSLDPAAHRVAAHIGATVALLRALSPEDIAAVVASLNDEPVKVID